ncbi:hypothetical protein RFI_29540, partial [Reticulomyxa filosa]
MELNQNEPQLAHFWPCDASFSVLQKYPFLLPNKCELFFILHDCLTDMFDDVSPYEATNMKTEHEQIGDLTKISTSQLHSKRQDTSERNLFTALAELVTWVYGANEVAQQNTARILQSHFKKVPELREMVFEEIVAEISSYLCEPSLKFDKDRLTTQQLSQLRFNKFLNEGTFFTFLIICMFGFDMIWQIHLPNLYYIY